jgi:hypothetical protein
MARVEAVAWWSKPSVYPGSSIEPEYYPPRAWREDTTPLPSRQSTSVVPPIRHPFPGPRVVIPSTGRSTFIAQPGAGHTENGNGDDNAQTAVLRRVCDLGAPSALQAAPKGPGEFLYWTPEELAGELRVSTKSVYRWASDDATMPQLRLGSGKGSTLRFPRDRMMRWLRQREGGPAGRPFRKRMPSKAERIDFTSKAGGQNGSCAISCAIEDA